MRNDARPDIAAADPADANDATATRAAAAAAAEADDYAPYPVEPDETRFGLAVSRIDTRAGVMTVRHGRRSDTSQRGPATALILLHGAAGSWSTFTPLIRAADVAGVDLGDLVIPDLPGWGDSALPDEADRRTISSISGAVVDAARALGYDRWVVLGHSLGGFVALDLAASQPRATERVLLVSPTTFSVMEAAGHPIRSFRALPPYVGMLLVMRALAALGSAGTTFVRAIGSSRPFRGFMAPLFAHPERVDASVFRALADEARPRSFAVASAAAARYDATRWRAIGCPVRSLSGSSDVFVADSDRASLGGVIPDFSASVLGDAGHFGHIERPAEVLRLLFATRA